MLPQTQENSDICNDGADVNRKPLPLYIAPVRKHCPICGEASYSFAGVHPQCAMKQADLLRMQRIKPSTKPVKKPASPAAAEFSRWQRVCPKCRTLVHVRKKACDCGHIFTPSTGH